nr:choice-of-anchor D domain-containing protein [Cellulomonas denverensis]
MTATSVADGSTAGTYVGANLTALHLELGAAVDFGQVAVGSTSAARTVSLRNITPNPVEIDLSQVEALADFGLAPGQPASVTVQPGDTTEVAVTFTPQRTGLITAAASARLTVHAVGSTVTSLPIFPTLSGTGVSRSLLMEAGAVDFGEVVQGDTVQQPVTISNTGNVPLRLSAGAVGRTGTGESIGTDEVEIALPTDELAPGATVAGTVTWHRAPADLDASVWIHGLDAGNLTDVTSRLITLTGTVTAPVAPPTTPPTEPEPDPTPSVSASPGAPANPGTTTGGADQDAATASPVLAVTGSGALFPVAAGAAGALLIGGLLLIARRRSAGVPLTARGSCTR